MLTLTYPLFSLLILLPLVIFLSPKHFTRQTALRFSHFDKLVKVTGSKPTSGAVVMSPIWWQRLLIVVTYLSLVIAATKPVWLGEPVSIEKSGREMMVAVDLSGSMEARDFVDPDGINVRRVDGVKLLLDDFLVQREGDRIGLIAFGDDAYLQAPFTDDFSIITQLLNEMDVRMAGSGTALGDAIGVAVNHFEHSDSANKVLILMTDGRDTTSNYPPIDAAHFAGENDITIYPIAIGDATNVGEDGIDLDMLDRIANYTGGQVFEALNGQDLVDVYKALNELEETLFDSYTIRPKVELYYWPLIVSLSLSLLALVIAALRGQSNMNKEI
ncbi:VWA domain-containing protein [Vibrio sp. Isolate33]|uniref:VWA domain-containing protein n=1 Tax=Vibrio sp. Isolate33 TaxID=2908539 RepID=UPI001EFDCE3D|nr:VWA domain-containing protein [Vibrio sp. Isolate33]MCG9545345.1 VWA domain-containing protein [Vibrio sp. Isolate33]